MLADDPIDDGEPEAGAGALGLGGEEGLENPRQVGGGDAAAVVRHRQHDRRLLGTSRLEPRHHRQPSAVRHRLAGVENQVHEHVLEELGVGEHRRQLRLEIGAHLDVAVQAGHDLQALCDQRCQSYGHQPRLRRPRHVEQAADHSRDPLPLADDELERRPRRVGLFHLAQQVLGVAGDDVERGPHLVGEAGGELAEQRRLLGLDKLPLHRRHLGSELVEGPDQLVVLTQPPRRGRHLERRRGVAPRVAQHARDVQQRAHQPAGGHGEDDQRGADGTENGDAEPPVTAVQADELGAHVGADHDPPVNTIEAVHGAQALLAGDRARVAEVALAAVDEEPDGRIGAEVRTCLRKAEIGVEQQPPAALDNVEVTIAALRGPRLQLPVESGRVEDRDQAARRARGPEDQHGRRRALDPRADRADLRARPGGPQEATVAAVAADAVGLELGLRHPAVATDTLPSDPRHRRRQELERCRAVDLQLPPHLAQQRLQVVARQHRDVSVGGADPLLDPRHLHVVAPPREGGQRQEGHQRHQQKRRGQRLDQRETTTTGSGRSARAPGAPSVRPPDDA